MLTKPQGGIQMTDPNLFPSWVCEVCGKRLHDWESGPKCSDCYNQAKLEAEEARRNALYQCRNCGYQGNLSDYDSYSEEAGNYEIHTVVKCPSCNQRTYDAKDHPKRLSR
jgi:predicted RNA-binding Zn-ribbon protein involved in translation (DUF1610 family)